MEKAEAVNNAKFHIKRFFNKYTAGDIDKDSFLQVLEVYLSSLYSEGYKCGEKAGRDLGFDYGLSAGKRILINKIDSIFEPED